MRPTFDVAATPLAKGATLIEASAGTGKTFTLSGLVLRLIVEEKLRIQQILVTTYTEAATEELRGRIRQDLRAALTAFTTGEAGNNALLKSLLAAYGGEKTALCERLDEAIRDFDEAAIFTIHGFCQRMLHDRAFESGALFDMELVTDQSPLVRELTADFWRREVAAEAALYAAVLAGGDLGPGTLGKLLTNRTVQPGLVIVPAPTRTYAEEKATLHAAWQTLQTLWQTSAETVREIFRGAGDVWAKGDHGNAMEVTGWLAALEKCLGEDIAEKSYLQCLKFFTPEALAKNTRAKKETPTHPFFAQCGEFLQQAAAFRRATKIHFLRWAETAWPERKQQKNVLTFDDLQTRLRAALNSANGEALTKQLQESFRAVLVDEFQDTDPVQYAIFRHLFAGGAHWLFFIGDPKQAIYAFRGADVFTYMEAAEATEREFTLRTNFRSETRLVEAVNMLFHFSKSRLGEPFLFAGIPFESVTAAGEREQKAALLEKGEATPPLHLWLVNEEPPLTKAVAEDALACSVASEIVRLLQSEVTLGGRRVQPHDIAVLVQKHKQGELVRNELLRRNVPVVSQNRNSVFQSEEAPQLRVLLQAVAAPQRENLLRAALATDILGQDGTQIHALMEDEAGWEQWRQRFQDYHLLWKRRGFIQMFRQLLLTEGVRPRLLARRDGERCLTNLLHLGELLQQAAVEEGLGVASLIPWLEQQMAADHKTPPDGHELRLERDEEAVQIVTMHKSKGLQYPVVFCPYTWEDADLWDEEDFSFHDPAHEKRLTHDLGSGVDAHAAQARHELLAEKMRLLYVALTRAQNRCYLVWGRFNSSRTRISASATNLLLNPPETTEEIFPALVAANAALDQAGFQACAEKLKVLSPHLLVEAMPEETNDIFQPPQESGDALQPRIFRGQIPQHWRVASFSALTAHQTEGEARPDYDAVPAEKSPPPENASGLFQFPRGPQAGSCLHKIFEEVDFQNTERHDAVIREKLEEFSLDAERFAVPVAAMVAKVLQTPLSSGGAAGETFTLASLPRVRCRHELEFHFPIHNVTDTELNRFFAADYQSASPAIVWDKLHFAPVEGFLKGFIDLVWEHEGRFYLADWKSNWLGGTVTDYHATAMGEEMRRHRYYLQYHLYTVALHRFLRWRVPGYDYEKNFGGVFYFFLRGIEPARPDLGLYADRPTATMIAELERLLTGDTTQNQP